jgi:hypothetical protein
MGAQLIAVDPVASPKPARRQPDPAQPSSDASQSGAPRGMDGADDGGYGGVDWARWAAKAIQTSYYNQPVRGDARIVRTPS